MRDSVESKDRIYIKEYGFLYFSKSMGKDLNKKYSQKRLDSAKKSGTDPIKTVSKRVIQKSAEATIDLIVTKIAERFKKVF